MTTIELPAHLTNASREALQEAVQVREESLVNLRSELAASNDQINAMNQAADQRDQELTQLREAVATGQESLRARSDEFVELARTHENFRRQVRAYAIKHNKDGQWCSEGTNEVLSDLGLPEYHPCFIGTATITVPVKITDTEDPYTAAHWVRAALEVNSSDTDVVVTDTPDISISQDALEHEDEEEE
ncbi:hypothetical protein [Amycolatopsis sp. GM8]|uniref:hypothetical protein n=1 Tax=Amycolatopsis sp. GM8 TaxID=2896530 RepID=UPI001F19FF4D|nr:hypothetical protein [Amycolatopsis sp. GM8]